MKHEKWLSCLVGAVLAFCIGLAGVGCLVTAFRLESADMTAVMTVCAISAVIIGGCFYFRHGGVVLLAATAFFTGYLLREGSALLQLESLIYTISAFYDKGYGCGTVRWSNGSLSGIPVTGGLIIMALVIVIAVCWTVCRRKWSIVAVGTGFLPLAACFVVTDTIPQGKWICLLLACFALILLTQQVRRKDPKAGLRLTAMLLIPVLLVSWLLFQVYAPERFEEQSGNMQQVLWDWISNLPFVDTTPEGELVISLDSAITTRTDLAAVGPKSQPSYAVMDVISDTSGVVYLRGQSMDSYDGTSWSVSQHSTGEDPYFPSENMLRTNTVRISTRTMQKRRFVPYYLMVDYVFTDGCIIKEHGVKDYQYMCAEPSGSGNALGFRVNMNDPMVQQCLQLPEETKLRAKKFLAEELRLSTSGMQDINFSTAFKAELIRSYVSQSARYDLQTQRMPGEEGDFALWFLEESETGYCVHFATAAAVLLRAAGIPARYVTGYAFEAKAGSKVTVLADQAHAWVEYLDTENGWTVLDATPAQWITQPETLPVPTQPEPTPPVTQPPTVPPQTQPQPTIPTMPVQTEPQPSRPTDPKETRPVEEGPHDPQVDLSGLWIALQILAWSIGAVLVLAVQYWLRKRRRNRKMHTGRHNQRALMRWREVLRLAKITKQKPPKALEELAEKAKFSQHTLTSAELLEFDFWLEKAQVEVERKPWYLRLMIRLVWAI